MSSAGRLLYVFNDADFFLSHRLAVARAAVNAGYEVHVATPDGKATAELGRQGLQHHPIPLSRRGLNPAREAAAILALVALYRRLRPDLVEHATIKPVLYGGLASRLVGIPSVSWMTGLGFVFISTGLRSAVVRRAIGAGYRSALGRTDARVIFENPDDLELFVSRRLVARKQVRLIRGAGVDMQAFCPTAEEPGVPLVVLASRMLRDKGVVEFVDAARLLRAERVPARLALVGGTDDGNPAGLPESRLRDWEREGVVEWWGHQRDMASVFQQSHVVCLPSYREGLPKVLVEAAAAGRAIVTTDAPGCREVVVHGENGLLVPVGDAPSLAAAIRRLVLDPAERKRMGARGRIRVQNEFSVARVVTATLGVYAETAS